MTTPSDTPAWHARYQAMWQQRLPEVTAAWEASRPDYEAAWQREQQGLEQGWAADPGAAPTDRAGYLDYARNTYFAGKREQHFSSAMDACAADAYRIEGHERAGVPADLQALMVREEAGRPLAGGPPSAGTGGSAQESTAGENARTRDSGNDVTR